MQNIVLRSICFNHVSHAWLYGLREVGGLGGGTKFQLCVAGLVSKWSLISLDWERNAEVLTPLEIGWHTLMG